MLRIDAFDFDHLWLVPEIGRGGLPPMRCLCGRGATK
jgi:hypothetical protein